MFSCTPEEWFGSTTDVDPIAVEIQERLLHDTSLPSPLSDLETNLLTIKHFLKNQSNNKDYTYNEIVEWINWRREFHVDEITEETIANELSTKEAFWHGKDKKNQPCLIITGRLHDISMTTGSGKSFQSFMIHLVESGFKKTQEENREAEKVCVLYDRRGLEFEHIDTFLYQSCTRVIADLQRWYSSKLGTIYILHLNTWFWILYQVILRPIFGLLTGDKIIVITNPADLLDYFDEDQLPPQFVEKGVSKSGESEIDKKAEEIVKDDVMKRDI